MNTPADLHPEALSIIKEALASPLSGTCPFNLIVEYVMEALGYTFDYRYKVSSVWSQSGWDLHEAMYEVAKQTVPRYDDPAHKCYGCDGYKTFTLVDGEDVPLCATACPREVKQ